uniref:Cell 5A endo1 putative n=1 Tax=Albugo laibachii Nc14 TaxID=890382 RepID=F0WYP2_9STRA|nr:cell 5A endo1 putative [Albugo laibachii Nc14]|eukprot:CCA26601.1 cell 5A endo1 putative [Albugo laibachii Nc14]
MNSNDSYSPQRFESFRLPSDKVWKDTSAQEYFCSYLDENPLSGDAGSIQLPLVRHMNAPYHDGIAIGASGPNYPPGGKEQFSGRKRTWPGALFLFLMVLASVSSIAYFGIQTFRRAQVQHDLTMGTSGSIMKAKKITPTKVCGMPNYVAANGKISIVYGSQKREIIIQGVNWSGMENKEGVPHGLAYKQSNIDDIAKKLIEMNVNAVRLPINAEMILSRASPNIKSFVNVFNSPELNVASYMDMIKKVIQALGKKQIAVLIDVHKVNPEYKGSTSEALWYSNETSISKMIQMYQTLATELCNSLHYNVMGVDVKNEPIGGCWPKSDSDASCPQKNNWPRAVERIGNAILGKCPNWMIFAEGLFAKTVPFSANNQNSTYSDWYGISLQNATVNPIKLAIENKLVYAPHFYSPSLYPTSYFFAKQRTAPDGSIEIVEYEKTPAGDALLYNAIKTVMDTAFGSILKEKKIPVLFGEFGGIYGANETLPGKTSTRSLDYVMQYAKEFGMVGGFLWALNPDGEYTFNEAYTPKKVIRYGVYEGSDWSDVHEDLVKALQNLRGSGPVPCYASANQKLNRTTVKI